MISGTESRPGSTMLSVCIVSFSSELRAASGLRFVVSGRRQPEDMADKNQSLIHFSEEDYNYIVAIYRDLDFI